MTSPRLILAVLCSMMLWTAAAQADTSPSKGAEGLAILSPLVEIKSRQARVVHLQDLRASLLDSLSSSGELDGVAIYVEDLNSGVWMGINERRDFRVGSLLKVAVMITWFRWDQEHPGMLKMKTSVLESDRTENDLFAQAVPSGVTPRDYHVIDLIEKMIVHSDNTAHHALWRAIPKIRLAETLSDIGLPNPYAMSDESHTLGMLTPKQYAMMLKALYNASYLDAMHSEMALRLLIRTNFNLGIRKNLPKGATAALKYSIWEGSALNECGIVYLRDHPYLICIFTTLKKNEFNKNLGMIREIWAVIHAHFSKFSTEHRPPPSSKHPEESAAGSGRRY